MKWLVFFLILPHIEPICVRSLWPTIDTVFDVGRLLSALLVLYLYVLKKKLPSMPVWFLGALQIWLQFVTYLRAQVTIVHAFTGVATYLAVALLIDFFSSNTKALLSGLMLNMEIMIYPNLVSVLLYYPTGFYQSESNVPNYFLGGRNSFMTYVLPTIVIALLYFALTGKKLRPLLLIAAGVVSISIVWSATSICGLLTFSAVLLLCKTSAKKVITYWTIFISTLVIDLLISVFRLMDRILLLADFIESFLRKEITLTGRTAIWDSFYQRFLDSPWIGYGVGAEAVVGSGLGAHNQWFHFLLAGGVIGLVLFLMFNFSTAKKLIQNGNYRCATLFYAFFASAYIIFIAEVYLGAPWMYIPLMLAYHVDKFEAVSASNVHRVYLTNRGNHVQNRKIHQEH